jgi:hypothetical protein
MHVAQGMRCIRVGTIEGQHVMPVEVYLAKRGEITPGQKAYDLLFERTRDYVQGLLRAGWFTTDFYVELYYTGLTEATLAAMDALTTMGVLYVTMRYDLSNDDYKAIRRRVGMRLR